FMNMLARLWDAGGADVGRVRQGVGSDERIGGSFLFAGAGYGGSCFPKDVKALRRTLGELGVDSGILDMVEALNEDQKLELVRQVVRYYGESLNGRTFGLWGLSFKPDTDDLREAPALVIIGQLLARGARVRAHDPEALENARRHFGEQYGDRLVFCPQNYDALAGADALLIITEWRQYRVPDFRRMQALLREPVIFDGRNLFEPARMRRLGFDYSSIGRPPVRRTDPAAVR
ncbi:MAG: UDP-glucose/GDP-mannose dehydrogenase family protein, partial [Gemmatimonadetes bacterium]|nr:UDP-glucose/GDP-mannose dehydrogenase family protein [Gemmatimonadota bacterium]